MASPRVPIVEVTGPQGGPIVLRQGGVLAGVTITDQVGYDSDECILRFRKMPPYDAAPAKGTRYTVSVRWSDGGPAKTGIYTVARVGLGGDADGGYEMRVVCRAGELTDKLMARGMEHFEDTTLGAIIAKVSAKAGYKAVVDPALAAIEIPYRLRNEQSRSDFLSDLATEFGGAMKIANETIVIIGRGKGTSGSGAALPVISPSPKADYAHDVEFDLRGDAAESDVRYHDPATGRQVRERRSGSSRDGRGRTSAIHPAASRGEASAAAKARADEELRATISGFFEMPGDPTAFAGAIVKPKGFGKDIDEAPMTASEVVDEITPAEGWRTTVTVERATT